jgi:membrane-bound serine protease (ClpP class)
MLAVVGICLGDEPSPASPDRAADAGPAEKSGAEAVLIPITGPIGPATSDFFVRALREAGESGARFVVTTVDTPGGLDTAMRDMIQAILASTCPLWPSCRRCRAAAQRLPRVRGHVAPMAPATSGAATPVQISGPPDRRAGAPDPRATQAASGTTSRHHCAQ